MHEVVSSPSERMIWQRVLRDRNAPDLILSYQLEVQGELPVSRVSRALGTLVTRYFPNLASRFADVGGVLYKRGEPVPENILAVVDGTSAAVPAKDAPGHQTIDHVDGPLFSFTLYRLAQHRSVLQLSFSHLVYDGTCYDDLCDSLEEAYAAAATSSEPKVDGLDTVELTTPPVGDEDLAFWRDYLKGRSLGQALPFLRKSKTRAAGFHAKTLIIDGEPYQRIRRLCRDSGVSIFQFILGSGTALIGRYLEAFGPADELTVCHTASLRTKGSPPGCYVNLVPLFLPYRSSATPAVHLETIKTIRHRIREHQHVPLHDIVLLADEKANGRERLVNVVINESPGLVPIRAPHLQDLSVKLTGRPAAGGPFDLAINFNASEYSIHLSLEAPSCLCSAEFLADFATGLEQTTVFFAEHPYESLSGLGLIKSWAPVAKGPTRSYAATESVIGNIRKAAQTRPTQTAVTYRNVTLTYSDLLGRVDLLCRRLRRSLDSKKLAQGIGIYVTRSEMLPAAIVTALALKVRFIPLDETLPPERLAYIIDAVGLAVVLADSKVQLDFLTSTYPHVAIIRVDEFTACGPDEDWPFLSDTPPPENESDTAYVMFTSGSTGNPKGVAISRANLFNFLTSMQEIPGIFSDDSVLALTPTCFDISLLELLLPLFCGASLDIVDNDTRRSAAALAEKIESSRVTVVQATPSTWLLLKNAGWQSNRRLKVLTGGEPIDRDVALYLLTQGHSVYNMYGPTETTIWASCARIDDAERISLGRPVNNTEYFIVDNRFEPVPTGAPGQLLIQGACVGQGYINVDGRDVFRRIEGAGQGTGYCTGDMVRHLGRGEIEFLGRIDKQVKIRGFRVELDEITAKIKHIVRDIDVLTVVRRVPENHICCFYCSHGRLKVDVDQVLAALRLTLPDYMIPQALIELDQFPLTATGKVDMKLLSESTIFDPVDVRATVPANQEEARQQFDSVSMELRNVIREVLNVDISDPLTPLGWYGLNSISYNLLSHELASRCKIQIPPHQFYAVNTLSALSEIVRRSRGAAGAGGRRAAGGKERSAVRLDNDLAIVGIAVLMPGGLESEAFWRALTNAENLVSERAGYRAGFLNQIDHFDERFFSISPLEAQHMDPRQRLLLQTCWQTLEDAGYRRSSLAGRRVGCYIAATGMDYAVIQGRGNDPQTPYSLPGSSLSMLANRLSYFFDWRGPSCTIDTACSGSVSALVKACQDLRSGSSEVALVGAANIIADHQITDGLASGNFLSPKARCAPFDASADGYVRGEGVCCVLIKRYEDAVRGGDAVYAVIKSYVENHGGRADSLTAPNPEAQKQLYLRAYTPELAAKVSYIETHGTGTKLGDPIEIDALKAAWKDLHLPMSSQIVWLGAVKSNIGHLEAAAGLASLAKAILALKHRLLPKNIHFNALNPLIRIEDSNFRILAESRPWESEGLRVAGITSFGFGGSNAHVVVAEAPRQVSAVFPVKPAYLVTLSARTRQSLGKMRRQLLEYLGRHIGEYDGRDIDNFAYTFNVGREHFGYRLAWVARDLPHLAELVGETSTDTVRAVALSDRGLLPDLDPENPQYLEQLGLWRERYLQGDDLDWSRLHRGDRCRRLHLPTYRFDERPHWLGTTKQASTPIAASAGIGWSTGPRPNGFRIYIPGNCVYFIDHQVCGKKVLPGVVHLELALEAARKAFPGRAFDVIQDCCWVKPVVCEGRGASLDLLLTSTGEQVRFELSQPSGVSSFGYLKTSSGTPADTVLLADKRDLIRSRSSKRIERDEIYSNFRKMNIEYGSYFRCIDYVDVYKNLACSLVSASNGHGLSSANLLDCALQSGMAISIGEHLDSLMPFSLGVLKFHCDLRSEDSDSYFVVSEKNSPYRTNISIFDKHFQPLISLLDLGVRASQLDPRGPKERHEELTSWYSSQAGSTI